MGIGVRIGMEDGVEAEVGGGEEGLGMGEEAGARLAGVLVECSGAGAAAGTG